MPGALEGRRRLSGAFAIALSRIRPDPTQPRKNLDSAKQRELTASIARLGVLQPISVRYLDAEDVYQVIAGERRFQAAQAAGLAEIPCWVQNPKSEDILLHQIVENWQRADLEPFELAEALSCLRDANGYSQKHLAELTGKPESEISRLLSLLTLDPHVQQETRSDTTGTFTKRHLTAIARLPQEDHQEAILAVREHHFTAQDTEKFVQERKAQATGLKTRGAPRMQPRRYVTSKAIVTLFFRRKHVTTADILAVLDEIRAQVEREE